MSMIQTAHGKPMTHLDRPIVARSPSDLVERAAAILAQQTSPSVSPGLAGTVDGQPHSSEAIEDLRRRAMALVSDLGRLMDTPQAPLAPALPWRRPRVPVPAGGSTSLALNLENLQGS